MLQLIPGLENAEIVRYGVMHRNTFINSPNLLRPTYQYKQRDDLFFAGQMTGVEGYVESAASGLLAGINAARLVQGEEPVVLPSVTAMGSMANYITQRTLKLPTDECELRSICTVREEDQKESGTKHTQHAL